MSWNGLIACAACTVCGLIFVAVGETVSKKQHRGTGAVTYFGCGLICAAVIIGTVKFGIEPIAHKVQAGITGTEIVVAEPTPSSGSEFIPAAAFRDGQD